MWGEATYSKDEEEQPSKGTANLYLMAKIDETEHVPANEVNSNTLQALSKSKLIELLLETLEDYKSLVYLKSKVITPWNSARDT